MSGRTRIVKGSLLVGGGQVASQGIAFARNILIARLLSPTDIGIASIFAMTMSFLEMITDLSAGTQLIQSKDGDDPRLQRTIHTVTVSRGVLMSALLLLLAWPFAWLFNVPQALWAFRWLALVPLARSLMHSDMSRLQRQLNFLPSVAADVGSQLITLAAAWPVAAYCKDYSAMLWLTILQSVIYAVTTHAFAKQSYRLAWDRSYAKRVMTFGWPLMINGLLMFAVFQGDRVVIGGAGRLFGGTRYTMADLGVYFLAFMLAGIPIGIPAKIGGAVFLPVLSRVQSDPARFCEKYQVVVQLYAFVGAVLALPLIIMGGWLAVQVYGAKYAAIGPIIMWLAAAQGVRLVRAAIVLAALSRGDTFTSMMGSVVRLSGLIGVLVAAALGASLAWVAASACAGEAITLAYTVLLLRRRHEVPVRLSLEPVAISLFAMVLGIIAGQLIGDRPALAALVTIVIVLSMIGTMLVCLAPFRAECSLALDAFRSRMYKRSTVEG